MEEENEESDEDTKLNENFLAMTNQARIEWEEKGMRETFERTEMELEENRRKINEWQKVIDMD